ncbi:MAG: DPP IV N-terminal domain-containing protein [Gemmatimonadaceae bacterium]
MIQWNSRAWSVALALLALPLASSAAQDRLKTYPGYQSYRDYLAALGAANPGLRAGALEATWIDSTTFEYSIGAKRMRYDVRTFKATEVPPPSPLQTPPPAGPDYNRQFSYAISPDGSKRAFYKDRNLWLSNADSSNAIAITTAGSEKARTRYGRAPWVYEEELDQFTSMWWSPDGSKLAYYGFDESSVSDYPLQLDQTKLYSTTDVEAYPKAGRPNPVVDLYVYDLATRQSVKLDIRDGRPFEPDALGHYAYHVAWTSDSRELTFNRTNRRQNVMELAACAPATGRCRSVVREEWPTAWVENSPEMRYLADGKRFIWASERTGFRNYYLYDLTGKLLAPLTAHAFEVGGIMGVDEGSGTLFYQARSGDNHMKMQLHRVGLNGKGDKRLTEPTLDHTVLASPNARRFVVVSQTHAITPKTRLLDAGGKVVAELGSSDRTALDKLSLQPLELFTFRAADSVTLLHGLLAKPPNFDANGRYPLLVFVYGGPASNGVWEDFVLPSPVVGYGFLLLRLDARSAGGRGKRFLDAIYGKLGVTEVDDIAAGVRSLCGRTYVDCGKIGIGGISYGGYVSAMAILRYPDLFAAAVASSPVTDWRHYDTIYTERYMWTPEGNPSGYDAGSAITYADKLRGRLMIYYGTADNNVHPNNAMQLIHALQRAGKSFEVQVGPDLGHGRLNTDRMMEFFIENLVLTRSASMTAPTP